jgi:hypothetical protein
MAGSTTKSQIQPSFNHVSWHCLGHSANNFPDMLYRVAVHRTDSQLFHEAGRVILTWAVNAAQPTAIVFTLKGAFSTPLSAVPEALREPIVRGSYQAWYSDGHVMVWLSPLNLV